ncbi:energy-coupling factor ABC transporter permease [Sinorhizobium saheli]|uniref:Cobalt transporter n=1 Tax=Sinorhizobium saheli TaxID=36856 RepID=A0A178YUN5_SINSA|nr:energy-coupling factor ABC transporter permease [Sinorhizobium saheli]MQW90366.1 cobalt transporter [Sinorhizobium saheli]OAP50455.1 cobalt transporter [Sinorhizobium saheli]
MHIEPGIVEGGKIVLSYATASGAALFALKSAHDELRRRGLSSLLSRTVVATGLVFSFFEILPHYPVGVSEVHLILGSTLFLLFGVAPAAMGLAAGLLIQGMFFAPFDLPQYGMNVTTLLVPLFALQVISSKIISLNTPYVDLSYRQTLALSTAYQGGIVSWVAFWALYGHGLTVESLLSIGSFGVAYLAVILIDPLVDILVLAAAKSGKVVSHIGIFDARLTSAK